MKSEYKNVLPPYSNTGVELTTKTGLIPLVDWVQGTFKFEAPYKLIGEILNLSKEDFFKMEKGDLGYKSGLRFADITVLYDGNNEMGTHFILTGKGCRQYEFVHSEEDKPLIELMRRVKDSGGRLTRLDLAIDDYKGYFKIPYLVRKIKAGGLVSKFKKARRIEDILIKDGSTRGTTLYFGSSQSDLMIRMYEKNYQMEVEKEIPMWNRIEIQLRDTRANEAMELLLEGKDIGEVILGILNHYLRFIVINKTDSNKSRAKMDPKWAAFLNDVEKLKLAKQPEGPSIDKKEAWLIEQASKTLFMVGNTKWEPHQLFNVMMNVGEQKMRPSDENLVAAFDAKTEEERLKRKRGTKESEEESES